MQNKKGVSLIVLSITILVMAILAATAIIALEDSGIIGRSKNTVSKQNYTEEYTRLQVIKNGLLTDNLGEITVDQYIAELKNKGLIEEDETSNDDNSKTVTTKTGFMLNIKQDGESNLILSLGENNSTIAISPTTLSADITDGAVTKTITATTSNVSGTVNWTTSNASVATVNGTNSGATITVKGVGTATITATYGAAKASCTVTATARIPTITLNPTTINKEVKAGLTATATITATTANISGTLSWTSSNTNVATVSGNGNTATVTMKATGTAVITATYGTASASCTVTVTEPEPSTVSITSASVSPTNVYPGENTFTFTSELEKSDEAEELTLTYKFYELSYTSSGWVLYDTVVHEASTTTSSSTINFTNVYTIPSGLPIFVTLEITDVSGMQKAFMNFDYGYLGEYPYTISVTCLPAGTMITVEEEYEDENGKKKKRRKKKRIEDITYDDDLVVWDFDNGCFTTAKPLWLTVRGEAEEYNLLKFSDGSELKTVRQHRIFNKELGKFTYPMTDETPIGTTTFNELGEEVTLVSKEVVEEKVSYYNIISHYHMNAFAEGILTSCRFSNLYEIKDMKYVKDDRELVGIEEYKDIPEEYYYGLRLAEQPKEVNRGNDDSHATSIVEHVRMYISRSKKK